MKLLRAYRNRKMSKLYLVFDLPNNCAASYEILYGNPVLEYYTSESCGEHYKSIYLHNPEYYRQMGKIK